MAEMTQAVGIDVVDIDRFKDAVDRWGVRILEKLLTPAEIAHCQAKAAAILSMAGRFAAKEAFIKCLNEEQYRFFSWQNVQVVNAESGKPSLKIDGRLAESLSGYRVLVSLSHSAKSAVAVVMIETAHG
jgi:holo-[acyl-carrier protein] synthase